MDNSHLQYVLPIRVLRRCSKKWGKAPLGAAASDVVKLPEATRTSERRVNVPRCSNHHMYVYSTWGKYMCYIRSKIHTYIYTIDINCKCISL